MYGLSKWEIVYHSSPQSHTLFHIEIKDTTTTERNYFDLEETKEFRKLQKVRGRNIGGGKDFTPAPLSPLFSIIKTLHGATERTVVLNESQICYNLDVQCIRPLQATQ